MKPTSTTHREHGDAGFVEDQREFFDRLITQDWETYLSSHWDRARQVEVREILRRVGTPKSVLDVGCGCGYHDVLFAEAGIDRVVGIDYSPQSIEQADRHYPHPNVRRLVQDFLTDHEQIERWGPFDLTVSFQVIEHLKQPEPFLRACAACTAPGGYVVVVTPNRNRLDNRLRRLAGRPIQMVDPLHFAEFAVGDLEALGRNTGLCRVGSFGHSMGIPVPGLNRIMRSKFGIQLGRLVPSMAVVIGLIWMLKPGSGGSGMIEAVQTKGKSLDKCRRTFVEDIKGS